ncbi:PTS-dependent dihydroxyacetone kinase phosphotransferase subunit DhaM [Streptomyces sp. Ru87]|uniref:PTS-dependent dihydroxyacetone kinase phosphotransferase subunit DhaM n=1 Tax=Streptomyces sp. Ru87 TaxID=2044307 RepID=UPI0027BA9C21|nr:hypothetical protein [Streptomyces sp. Ru87]
MGGAGAPAEEAPEAAITGSAPQAGTAGTGSAADSPGGGTARGTGTGPGTGPGRAAEPPAGAPPGAAASEPAPDVAARRPEQPGGGTGLGAEAGAGDGADGAGDGAGSRDRAGGGTGAAASSGPDKSAGHGVSAPRVGVVLVSHSREVAEATAALAEALVGAGTPAPVAVAGGTEDGRVGTSAVLVRLAVERVDRGRGVVVLCDMGSAVLTVKTLLADSGADGLPPDVRIADAPFVEGAVAALVTASTGADLPLVLSAADDARTYRKL